MDIVGKLYNSHLNIQAIKYLQNRGFTKETIQRFNIGYANISWSKKVNNLVYSQEFENSLIKVGHLFKRKTGIICDKFYQRIVFPIRNLQGKTLGFGGRVMTTSFPKYINSSDSIIFSKGKCLYGIYEKKDNCFDQPVLIVEGYTDVMML